MLHWYLALRAAALWRHEVLVRCCYPPGPTRDAEAAKHVAFVKLVYGF